VAGLTSPCGPRWCSSGRGLSWGLKEACGKLPIGQQAHLNSVAYLWAI
jgi:hypothetical protein